VSVNFEKLCTENLVFKTIKERRSVRLFKTRDIDDNTLQVLIQAAQWSPSAWDTQTWRFIIVRDRDTRLSIINAVLNIMQKKTNKEIIFDEQKKFLGIDAPVQVFICNDTREIRDTRIKSESKINCYAAIQNFLLAAHALGLGACWQGDPILAADEIKRLLHIPNGVEPVSSVALGYPMEIPNPPPRKQGIDKILFYEKMD
jgi:nitroreductase